MGLFFLFRASSILLQAILTQTNGAFLLLHIAFSNSLDLDQVQHYVGPDLDTNCLTL